MSAINGQLPYYEGHGFRLYVYNGSFHKDPAEKWFGKLTINVGCHWIFVGDSIANSKNKALKALLQIHNEISMDSSYCRDFSGTTEHKLDQFLDWIEVNK
jgi:hypothetical protein